MFVVVSIGYGGYRIYMFMDPDKRAEKATMTEKTENGSAELSTLNESENPQELVLGPEILSKMTDLEAELLNREETQKRIDLEQAERAEKTREENSRDARQFAVHKFVEREAPSVEELSQLFEQKLFVDQHSNTVVVGVDTADDLLKVGGLLKLLDSPSDRRQYRVEAVIVNASIDDTEEFSIDWLAKYSYPVPRVPNWDVGLGNGFVGLQSEWLDLSIEKAKTAGAVAVLARPSLILSEGEQARISSGREIPIPVTNVQDGNAQTSVEFRQVALELVVTIEDNGSTGVILGIQQVNAAVAGITQIQDNEVPELASQEWESQITPRLGVWYALGGVASTQKSQSERRGWIFRDRASKSIERQEIGLFVRVLPGELESFPPQNIYDVTADENPAFIATPILRAVPLDK